jgi:glycosyltransferase involved in cell wall biosynthesis
MDPRLTTVVIATQRLARDGGVGVHVTRVIDALRSAGRRVVAVAGEVPEASRGPDAHELPGLQARRIDGRVLAALDRLLAGIDGPVVTHAHHLWDPALVGRLRAHGPVVWSVHEFAACPTGNYYFEPGHECHRHRGPGCIPHIAFHGCAHTWNPRTLPARYRRTGQHVDVLRAADAVLAYSTFVARHVRRNGVREVHVAPLIVPSVPGWAAASAESRVLYAGRLTPNKGLGTLLEAMRSVDGRLDVVGGGWWRDGAVALAGKLGVADRVEFHGWQPAEAVDGFYRRASVVSVPSHWPEPFGMVGPEALAHGRPVVASDTGGIPEWLDHARTGYLVPAGDAERLADGLRALLADSELCRRMGETGAAQVRERYSPAAHVAALDDLHARLGSPAGTPGLG